MSNIHYESAKVNQDLAIGLGHLSLEDDA